jgi:ribA/ribD-fused uncharacterized protein
MSVEKCQDRQSLIDYLDAGNKAEYLLFWGHQPSKDGTVTQSCFSQWFGSKFTIDGITYPTAEHFMMASKARLFNDLEAEQSILKAKHPRDTQRIGRGVRGFDNKVWEEHRFEIVVRGNLAKFSQNEAFKEFLLNTKNRVIVEASPDDRIWGIGIAADNPDAKNPRRWAGTNLLGFALMEVRARLLDGESV